MDLSSSDPFNGGSSTASFEEIGSEDDLFSTYIDVDKLGGNGNGANCADQNGGGGADGKDENGGGGGGGGEGEKSGSGSGSGCGSGSRPRHRHSSSVDGLSTSTSAFGEIMEAKKAMPPDKLAELWTIDPKRAKRYVFFLVIWVIHFPLLFCVADKRFVFVLDQNHTVNLNGKLLNQIINGYLNEVSMFIFTIVYLLKNIFETWIITP